MNSTKVSLVQVIWNEESIIIIMIITSIIIIIIIIWGIMVLALSNRFKRLANDLILDWLKRERKKLVDSV